MATKTRKKTHRFKGGYEPKVWDSIPKKAKLRTTYESETIGYVKVSAYLPDFVYVREDGSKMYIECKGHLDYPSRLKMQLVKEQHPDLDIRMMFEKDNRVTNTKMRYSDWAYKWGFPFAIGKEIPKEWFK